MPGESANAVPHYHKLCSRVSHIWGNRRGQHIRSAMDKPRPGKTTFVIMVSPLPGKYELLGPQRPRPSRSPRPSRTVTSLTRPPHPRRLGGPSPPPRPSGKQPREHLDLGTRGTWGRGLSTTGSLCAPCSSTYDTPLS